MIHSRAHNVFVPVCFLLSPGKTEDIYHHAIQTTISASELETGGIDSNL
jgi:hypothetical protein